MQRGTRTGKNAFFFFVVAMAGVQRRGMARPAYKLSCSMRASMAGMVAGVSQAQVGQVVGKAVKARGANCNNNSAIKKKPRNVQVAGYVCFCANGNALVRW